MERLTIKAPSGLIHLKDNRKMTINEAIKKLSDYEDLEKQGVLLKLPCKVGDTVYEVQEARKRIQQYTIFSIRISNCNLFFGWVLKDGNGIYSNVHGFFDYAIGRTVFLTQAEAEKALKGVKNENEV